MKIAYVTTYDASNVHAWSGSGYYIKEALTQSGFKVENIGSLKINNHYLVRAKRRIHSLFSKKLYQIDRDVVILNDYAFQVNQALKKVSCDIVFSPGTIPIAHLQTDKPIVFWTDATFAGMIDFYPEFSNLSKTTIKKGNEMEQHALTNCALAIYSSEWAAKSAINNYNVDPCKVKVVPFGANITSNRDINQIKIILNNKSLDICKLLFIGVDWIRKGGDKALAVANMLNSRGIQTELYVVGCYPGKKMPEFVKVYGFISKKTPEGLDLYNKLMTESHFLILPSIAECCAVVLAEASSYGLPSLATNVGGIITAIRDGKNGKTFSLNAESEIYCQFIEDMILQKDNYYKLAISTYNEYTERLNWSSSGNKVYQLIKEIM